MILSEIILEDLENISLELLDRLEPSEKHLEDYCKEVIISILKLKRLNRQELTKKSLSEFYNEKAKK